MVPDKAAFSWWNQHQLTVGANGRSARPQNPPDKKPSFVHEERSIPSPWEHLSTFNLSIPRHSTVTALNELSTVIADGFNQRKPAARTVLVALDLSKAFRYCVSRYPSSSWLTIPRFQEHLYAWLATYLHGRQARTLVQETRCQAVVLSDLEFHKDRLWLLRCCQISTWQMPMPMPPPTIFLVSYADDFTVFALGTDIETLSKDINSYLTTLCNFLDSRDLEVSTPKCSVTLFTPSTKEHKITPDVKINGKALILLGVTFDTALTFGPHCKLAAARGRRAEWISWKRWQELPGDRARKPS